MVDSSMAPDAAANRRPVGAESIPESLAVTRHQAGQVCLNLLQRPPFYLAFFLRPPGPLVPAPAAETHLLRRAPHPQQMPLHARAQVRDHRLRPRRELPRPARDLDRAQDRQVAEVGRVDAARRLAAAECAALLQALARGLFSGV
jgi:hypothetical protein